MPCAVMKSLLYPASPTSAQPGSVRLAEVVRDRGAREPRFPLGRAHALGELGRQVEHLHVVAFDVVLVRVGFRERPARDDEGQAVVRRRGREAAPGSHVHVEAAVDRQAAEVRVVAAQQVGLLVVLLRRDGTRETRVPAVGTHDHSGVLRDGLAALSVSSDADDLPVVHDDVVDRELLAHLGARFGRAVDEQLVEDGAARAVRDRRVCACPGAPEIVKGPKSNE